VHRDDRGVIEQRLDASLSQEPADVLLRRISLAQTLDRHIATELGVMAEHHLAHATAADHGTELVPRDRCGWRPFVLRRCG
jgi:hypothetical protein